MASAVADKAKFSIEDDEKNPQFTIEDEAPPNVASEKEMAAHPPKPTPQVDMHQVSRLTGERPLPRTPGSDEEAIREGSGPGGAGLAAIGTLGVPIEAIATRSLAPFAPLVRSAIGAYAGGHLGRFIGGKVGFPEAGENVGAIAGGAYGAAGGRVPHGPGSLASRFLTGAEETPTRLKPINAASEEPFQLTAPHAETEPAIQQRLSFPEPESTNATAAQRTAPEGERLQRIGNGNGYKPSEKVATMSAERRNLGSEFEAGEVSHEIERNRSIIRNPSATAEDVQIAQSRLDDLGANRLQPIGKARSPRGYTNLGRSEPVKLEDVVNQATGVKPLKADVPLNEQFTRTTAAEAPTVDPIKAKYPDPKIRQMVRANGEQIYEAAKHNPATVQAIHDLTRVDLRQALINAGEDVGQQTVTNSKFAGQGGISREEAFNRLLQKGHSAEQIVKLAKQVPGETKAESFLPEEKAPAPASAPASTLSTKRAMRERAGRIRAARL